MTDVNAAIDEQQSLNPPEPPEGIALPAGVGLDDEVALMFEVTPDGIQVEASLEHATITVRHIDNESGYGQMAMLVQTLPFLLTQAYDQMEDNDEPQEATQ